SKDLRRLGALTFKLTADAKGRQGGADFALVRRVRGKEDALVVFASGLGPVIYCVPVTFWSPRCALPTIECADVSGYRRAEGTARHVRDTVGVTEKGRNINIRLTNSPGGSGV